MTYLTPAAVIQSDILDSCRSHASIQLTPAGVNCMQIYSRLLQESYILTYLTPAGLIHSDILESCRSHTWRLLTPAGVIQIDI